MKSQDFASVLRAYADILGAADARVARDRILALASIFDAASGSTVAALMKRLGGCTSASEPSADNPNLGEIARLIMPLKDLFSQTAKAGVVADATAVESFLGARASMRVADLAKPPAPAKPARSAGKKAAAPVRDDLVAEYLKKLEAHLGDQEKFALTFNALREDSAIGKAELLAITKQFAGASGKSRADWLKKIWNRHQSLLTFKAKAKATAGRTAA